MNRRDRKDRPAFEPLRVLRGLCVESVLCALCLLRAQFPAGTVGFALIVLTICE